MFASTAAASFCAAIAAASEVEAPCWEAWSTARSCCAFQDTAFTCSRRASFSVRSRLASLCNCSISRRCRARHRAALSRFCRRRRATRDRLDESSFPAPLSSLSLLSSAVLSAATPKSSSSRAAFRLCAGARLKVLSGRLLAPIRTCLDVGATLCAASLAIVYPQCVDLSGGCEVA